MMRGFGRALKDARNRANLSQSKLAERADFDHSYLSRMESGKRNPSQTAVHKIADALGLEMGGTERDALLVAAGFLPFDLGNVLPFRELGDFISVYDHAPDDTRRRFREVIELLIHYGETT